MLKRQRYCARFFEWKRIEREDETRRVGESFGIWLMGPSLLNLWSGNQCSAKWHRGSPINKLG